MNRGKIASAVCSASSARALSCARRWIFSRSSCFSGNDGIQDHVGVEVERAIQVSLERGQADGGRFEVPGMRPAPSRSRPARPQSAGRRACSFPRRASPTAIDARPSFPLGVEGLARFEDQVEGHDRQVVPLDDPELEAVRKPSALEARRRIIAESGPERAFAIGRNRRESRRPAGLTSAACVAGCTAASGRVRAAGAPGMTSSSMKCGPR